MEHKTQAQEFAEKYAKGVGAGIIKMIDRVAAQATAVLIICMVVSYFHQGGFLASQASDVTGLERLGQLAGAWLIPIALDLLTLSCVQIIRNPAMEKNRIAALVAMLIPAGISGTINFLGPGTWIIKGSFVTCVVLIVISEFVVSLTHKPDFQAIDKMEREMVKMAEQEPEAVRKGHECPADGPCPDRRHYPKPRVLTPAEKRKAARATRAKAALVAEPVSSDSLIVVSRPHSKAPVTA